MSASSTDAQYRPTDEMTVATDSNQGPWINVATWISLVAMGVAVVAKLFTKWNVLRTLQKDDYIMLVAALFAVTHCIATTQEVADGIGRHEESLSASQVGNVEKIQYSAELLYIITIFLAKIADLTFFITLLGPHNGRFAVFFCIALCSAWIVIGLFVVAFQCRLPSPWAAQAGSCMDRIAFWTVSAVVDILTQLFVAFLPAVLLKELQLPLAKKLFSMLSFTPNLLTIALTISRLFFIYHDLGAADRTGDWYNLVLTSSLHVQFSVCLAAVPFLRSIIDSMILMPSMIADTQSSGLWSSSLGRFSKSKPRWRSLKPSEAGLQSPIVLPDRAVRQASITGTGTDSLELREPEHGQQSQERMVIYETRTFEIT